MNSKKNTQVREFSAWERCWFYKAFYGKKIYGVWPEEEKEICRRYAREELQRQKEEGLVSEDEKRINLAAAIAKPPRKKQKVISAIMIFAFTAIIVGSTAICICLSRGVEFPAFFEF